MEQSEKLRKAAIDTTVINTGGGILNAAQADKFIDLTVDSQALLKRCRVERVTNPSGSLQRLLFADPITEGASENTDSGRIDNPTFSEVTYATVKMRSAFDITVDSLEGNIEGPALRNTLMASAGKRIGTDLEMVSLIGDTTLADTTNLNKLLRVNQGWRKLSDTGNLVDCAGANISKTIFSKLIRALPSQYKTDRSALRFYCSPAIIQDYRDVLADRATALGDSATQGNDPLKAFGIPIEEIPLIPEALDCISGSAVYADGSFVWLTFPQNFIFIISRDIEVYWEFKPRTDKYEATVYTKVDAIIENVDALVCGYDVRVKGAS